MKIGIIVHSETGNTYSVALKLHEKLIAVGHLVEIERLRPIGAEQTDAKKYDLKSCLIPEGMMPW